MVCAGKTLAMSAGGLSKQEIGQERILTRSVMRGGKELALKQVESCLETTETEEM